MPKASPPKVRRFNALLLDLGFDDRASFAAAKDMHRQQLSTLLSTGHGWEPYKARLAKALGISRAELDAIVANETRIVAARRAAKAGAR